MCAAAITGTMLTITIIRTRTSIAERHVRQLCHCRLERGEPAEDRPRQHLDLRGRSRWGGMAGRKSADAAQREKSPPRIAVGCDGAWRTRAARFRFSIRLSRRLCAAARAQSRAPLARGLG